ncbi:hypothetical protein D7Z54_02135 [Salibacterium salarium]|uniref:Uncharacterized protein n=1 Tax=Salibacterium salarium TaxID=284579 RepID=A0A3R9QX96_9BACI|nr:hypothetical protein [Salibacterium salarium]RSL35385.1 hypothetical protein D7Z54_02135 [Salibacterium salarium]
MEEFIRYEESGLNTTTDDEVNEMLTDVIKLCEKHVQRLTRFMKDEGVHHITILLACRANKKEALFS